jgi:NADH-quinone oxidoreductase subunit M
MVRTRLFWVVVSLALLAPLTAFAQGQPPAAGRAPAVGHAPAGGQPPAGAPPRALPGLPGQRPGAVQPQPLPGGAPFPGGRPTPRLAGPGAPGLPGQPGVPGGVRMRPTGARPLPPAAAVTAGPKPQVSLEPASLSFGADAGEQVLRVVNRGQAPLTVKEVRLAPQSDPAFTLGAKAEPQTLAPNQALEVKVAYKRGTAPQAFGAVQVVTDDATQRADAAGQHVAGAALKANGSDLLTWMVFFPLIGVLVLLLVPKSYEKYVKWIALGAAAVPAVLAVYLYQHFDREAHGLQFVQHFVWVRSFNIEYFFGADGVSVSMIILTALVSLIAVGASWGISKHVKGYFAMFLLLETGMMGVFCALDFFLFYVFWEVMLLPMYFLIGIWGGPRKEYAAIKFFLYTLAGSVFMLLALIALYYTSGATVLADGTPAQHTFDLIKLASPANVTAFMGANTLVGFKFTYVVWVALFVGFAIKIPMFPFHTWLPDAHVEAPTAISVILAGVLLKMGTYGIMRINFGILPEATRWAGTAMAVFGVINILYGGFCAMAQKDLKKLVAYSSVSHMGYCLLGMAAFTTTGMTGAMFQMFNHGTITSMLFILVGVIYDRAHTRGVNEFGGLATKMPIYAAFFSFAFMASLGLPGLSGFISEILVFLGSFPVFKVLVILAATGVIVTAGYHLWAIQRIHLGAFNEEKWGANAHYSLINNDLNLREALTLIPLAIIVLILGFYPNPMLSLIHTGMADLTRSLQEGAGAGGLALLP